MSARIPPPLLLALAAALAGCAAPASAPATDAGSGEDASGAPPDAFTLGGCTQLHMFFPSPAAPFEAFVPEGFTLATSDPAGATVNVGVSGTVCGEDAEAWVEVPVSPPAELARDGALHVAPVVGYVSNATILERYAGWGLGAFANAATVHLLLDTPSPHLQVDTPDESYEWSLAMRASGGGFAESDVALWIPREDGTVAGILWRENSPSTNLGAGAVAMRYQGNGGSPPAHAGIVHAVTDLEVTLRAEAIA